jgi:hypothetical protein
MPEKIHKCYAQDLAENLQQKCRKNVYHLSYLHHLHHHEPSHSLRHPLTIEKKNMKRAHFQTEAKLDGNIW